MEISINISEDCKTQGIKGKGMPQAIAQDIFQTYYPYSPINQLLTADNDFYRAVDNIEAISPVAYMPYLCHNTVFHASDKHQQDISGCAVKSPYSLKEGIICACRQMYNAHNIPPLRGRYRYYTQAYYLYSALCVGADNNGNVSILTANKSVLDQLPVYPFCEGTANTIMSMANDDIKGGVVQCVELVPNSVGYSLRPAVVYANRRDYVIAPKAWLDYLINSINIMLTQTPCRVSYIGQDGQVVTVIVCNIHYQSENKPSKYGEIKCNDVVHNCTVDFPVSQFISIEPCGGC